MPEDASWESPSQMMVDLPIVAVLYDQGETADKPRPTPRINNTRDREAEAAAPASTAAHETPELLPLEAVYERSPSGKTLGTADSSCCITLLKFSLCLAQTSPYRSALPGAPDICS